MMRTRRLVAVLAVFVLMVGFAGSETLEAQWWSCKVCGQNEYEPQCELAAGENGPEGYRYCYAYSNGCHLSDMCGFVV